MFEASSKLRDKGQHYDASSISAPVTNGMTIKLVLSLMLASDNIAQAVCDLARYMTCGNSKKLDAMYRCMRYVLCTKDAGLLLKPSRKWDGSNEHQFRIRGQSDSDYGMDTQT